MYQPVALFLACVTCVGVQRIASVVSSPGFYHRHYPRGDGAGHSIVSDDGFERELQNNILGLMPQAILLLSMALLTRSNSRKRQSNWTR